MSLVLEPASAAFAFNPHHHHHHHRHHRDVDAPLHDDDVDGGVDEVEETAGGLTGVDADGPVLVPASLVRRYGVEKIDVPMEEYVRELIIRNKIDEGPFIVFDLGVVVKQYLQWVTLLPRVEPFYAVKCNPDPAMMALLHHLGAGFDCASRDELSRVLPLGTATNKIIFANPCKQRSHVEYARQHNVPMMTFDNADELRKIAQVYPDAELVLRVLPDDSKSVMKFGSKFGASSRVWAPLLQLAKELGLNVVGISFHVGSGCYDASAFDTTLRIARKAFDAAIDAGHRPTLLDIGGGFPGTDEHKPTFKEIADVIRPVLDELFPASVRVIGEPGRYFAHQTQTVAANVFARRRIESAEEDDEASPAACADATGNSNTAAAAAAAATTTAAAAADAAEAADPSFLYYINDGVYASFNCIMFDHALPVPRPLIAPEPEAKTYTSNVFGPTCDSMDLVNKAIQLPLLEPGSWLVYEAMGAYTSAAASTFNGFRTDMRFYVFNTSAL